MVLCSLLDGTYLNVLLFWNHTNGRVLNEDLYTQNSEITFLKLFFLHLLLDLFHRNFCPTLVHGQKASMSAVLLAVEIWALSKSNEPSQLNFFFFFFFFYFTCMSLHH